MWSICTRDYLWQIHKICTKPEFNGLPDMTLWMVHKKMLLEWKYLSFEKIKKEIYFSVVGRSKWTALYNLSFLPFPICKMWFILDSSNATNPIGQIMANIWIGVTLKYFLQYNFKAQQFKIMIPTWLDTAVKSMNHDV